MIAYFPVPYKDEILYSIIARYAVHTGQAHNQKAVLRDVFGSVSAVAIPDLPSHLSSLAKRISHIWIIPSEEVIQCHTLAPIYLPFLLPLQSKQIVMSMLSSQGGDIYTRAGISASSVRQQRFFRYCPACIIEQLEIYGEPFWNRIHQVVGVNFCLKHQCKLATSELHFHPKQKHLYQAAATADLNKEHISSSISEIDTLIINRFHELINLRLLTGHCFHQWTSFYQQLAKDLGLMNKNRVDHAGIREILIHDWRKSELGAHITNNSENNWLTNIFRKHRKTFHPLRHLLVWSSLLPDKSVKEIIATVNNQQKDEPKKPEQAKPVLYNPNELTQTKRNEWLRLQNQYKGYGIKAIRSLRQGGSTYAWLYRNDRCWLVENSPPLSKRSNGRMSTDYSNWDRENIVTLENFKLSVLQFKHRQRLSRTFLIKQLSRANSVEKHLSDLPITDKWLSQNAESIEEYQMFRIARAAKLLQQQYLTIKRWRLLRLAGIRAEKVTPKIECLIQKLEFIGSID